MSNINFDNIYYEEDEKFDIHIKPGDIISNQSIDIWYNNKWFNYYYYYYYDNFTIDKIELSNNINGNPYGNFNNDFKKIPDNIIIFSIKNNPFWFKYHKKLKIK